MDTRHLPARQCIGCRKSKPKAELLRFVKKPSGDVFFDHEGTSQGRGFYLCPDEKCFAAALKSKRAKTAYFRKVDAVQEIMQGIREKILEFIERDLSICKRMGYLFDARSEEQSIEGDDLVLVISDNLPEEKVARHTSAHRAQARRYHLPAAGSSRPRSCAVSTGFPMAERLSMNLQKYEGLSSKGRAL